MSRELIVYLMVSLSLLLGGVALYFSLKSSRVVRASNHELYHVNNNVSDHNCDGSRIHGCDISHWDGDVDWHMLKRTGVRFVFIKATQGGSYIDPNFTRNWSSAGTSNLYRGAYHFFDPDEDPLKQAAHFLRTVSLQKGDLIPVLDIEIAKQRSHEELVQAVNKWLIAVTKSIGHKPIIYTDRAFWERHINHNFSDYPLWIAEWEEKVEPKMPSGWKNWLFWQYSSSGSLNGINHSTVDLNCFNGDVSHLKQYLIR